MKHWVQMMKVVFLLEKAAGRSTTYRRWMVAGGMMLGYHKRHNTKVWRVLCSSMSMMNEEPCESGLSVLARCMLKDTGKMMIEHADKAYKLVVMMRKIVGDLERDSGLYETGRGALVFKEDGDDVLMVVAYYKGVMREMMGGTWQHYEKGCTKMRRDARQLMGLDDNASEVYHEVDVEMLNKMREKVRKELRKGFKINAEMDRIFPRDIGGGVGVVGGGGCGGGGGGNVGVGDGGVGVGDGGGGGDGVGIGGSDGDEDDDGDGEREKEREKVLKEVRENVRKERKARRKEAERKKKVIRALERAREEKEEIEDDEEVGVAVDEGVPRRKRKRGESLVRAVEESEDEVDVEEARRIRDELLEEQRSAHGGVRRMKRKTKGRAQGFSFHDLSMWDFAAGFG